MQPMIHQELARLRAQDLLRDAVLARRGATARVVHPEPGRLRRRVGRGLVRAGMRLLGERPPLGEGAPS